MQPKNLVAVKRYRASRLAKLVTRSYYLHRRGKDETMYNEMCDEFLSLGGVYVKFLQGVLLRSKAMRHWTNPEKLRIFEKLDYEPLDVIAFLRNELNGRQLSEITHIHPQPFAAGSFGQVYYAQHISGKPIIIKILRPMVREMLRFDLKLLGAFTKRFYTRLYQNITLDINDAVKEFSAATLRETDYINEAAFAHELYEYYKEHPYYVIPETFMHLCTKNIIVQEYIDGLSVAQLISLKEQGVDPVAYVHETIGSDLDFQLLTLGHESFSGIFKLRRVQGDPHPGNIRLLPNNKVGMIDFGISAKAPEDRSGFFGIIEAYSHMFHGSLTAAQLFEHSMRFFVRDLYRSLIRISSAMNRGEGTGLATEISELAEQTFERITGSKLVGMDAHNENLMIEINKLVNKGNRFGISVRLEDTEILRAIQTYSSVLTSLGRYQEVMPPLSQGIVNTVRQYHPEMLQDDTEQISLSYALQIVSDWLERVAERDPILFRDLVQRIQVFRNSPDIKGVANA